MTQEKYNKLRNLLLDNGVDPDEVDIVAQAVCYVLLDEETEEFTR